MLHQFVNCSKSTYKQLYRFLLAASIVRIYLERPVDERLLIKQIGFFLQLSRSTLKPMISLSCN